MIERVPGWTFVASLDRTREIATALGSYSIHHLAPEVFGGFDGDSERGYVATAEKALFDTIYIRAPRGGRAYSPELSLPAEFDDAQLDAWTRRITVARLRTVVTRGLDRALQQAGVAAGRADVASR